MPKMDTDKVKDENQLECLATSRSRRQLGDRHGRKALFQKLKDLKGAKNKWEVSGVDNVYEEVNEDEYAERRQNRLEEDWIVDDDGSGYVEDGREIFDEEDDQELFTNKRTSCGKKKAKHSSKTKKSGYGNIKDMFENMPSKKRKVESLVKLEEDDILGDILNDLKSDSPSTSRGTAFNKMQTLPKPRLPQVKSELSTFKCSSPMPAKLPLPKPLKEKTTPLTSIKELETTEVSSPTENSKITDMDDLTADMFDDDLMDVDVPSDKSNLQETKENIPVTPSDLPKNQGFLAEFPSQKPVLGDGWETVNKTNGEVKVPEVHIDASNLPLVTKDNGERVFRFFWLDAFEDHFNHPGVVHLFGKIWIESANTHVSCCVIVKNIERCIFLLPRLKRLSKNNEEGEDVKMMDVYQEFDESYAKKNKILEFKCRKTVKKYAFEKTEVPSEAEYFEMRYSASYPAPPKDFSGETFSHAFGTNTSSLELLLLGCKIKGPCWLEINGVQPSSNHVSWCKIEAIAPNVTSIRPVYGLEVPPVTVMSFKLQTKVNPKTHQNEIVMASCLVHNSFPLDKASPQPPFQTHFCAITHPVDCTWPWDFKKVFDTYNDTKVEKCNSERSLLGYLLTKIFKIDPDVIIGHDIIGFDLGVLLHRIQINKIPLWSRLGRLKRMQIPKLSNKSYAEKVAVSGRLVCDTKISAKELIQAKSYDLGPLIMQVLKTENARLELTSELIKKMFENSESLKKLINASMQDAVYILRIAAELNALPLALQITNIAGNVMSRTLLGGRSERNEFLLLHAFNEKNYICPDKQYGKQTTNNTETDVEDGNAAKGKKKSSYAGGLVLDPKRGFYDDFILLMDFNSLYPSIIQEYNICFTTINRELMKKDSTQDDLLSIELPDSDETPGILPTEIRKLVESRKQVKGLMKQPKISPDLRLQYDIRQKALKLTANSMYGCLGFSFSRFYAKHLAALVTAKGREILLNTKDVVCKMNFDVIYGDTDSIMINTNSKNYGEVVKLGHKIKHEINKLYKLLELDVDGVFKYMLLLKKKKYAAVTVARTPSGELIYQKELKGLDIVRRDWCQLSANAGKHILDQILSDQDSDERIENIHSHLQKCAEDLNNGKVRLGMLVITKQLTKNPTDYPDKQILPHVQVALRVNATGEKKLRKGDTVPYVICEDGSNLPATQRAYHVDEINSNPNLKIDCNYYLAQQLHPVVSRICDPLPGTDASRIAEVLGLDPSQYRSNRQYSEPEVNQVELCEEEKYRLCERFSYKCLTCDTLITVDAPTRGSGSSMSFVLEMCPNPKCNNTPSQNANYIINKLRLDIRRHIATYYKGWLVCEDPSCNARTRRIGLRFSRGFPICGVCQKNTMFREYTEIQLYHQLCFYSYIFDMTKAVKANKELRNKMEPVKKLYTSLFQEVERHLKLSSYSTVNLGDLFSRLYVKSAKKARGL